MKAAAKQLDGLDDAASFVRLAVQQAVQDQYTRAKARDAENLRRVRPFPSASDPLQLVQAGSLVDVTPCATRAVEDASSLRGFRTSVFITPNVAEAMRATSVQHVLGLAWHAARRYNAADGLPRTPSFQPVHFVVNTPAAEFRLLFRVGLRPDGTVYNVITTTSEPCPIWTPDEI